MFFVFVSTFAGMRFQRQVVVESISVSNMRFVNVWRKHKVHLLLYGSSKGVNSTHTNFLITKKKKEILFVFQKAKYSGRSVRCLFKTKVVRSTRKWGREFVRFAMGAN